MQLFAFTVDRETAPGSWERIASWERFGMDEAEALSGTIRAARDEFPANALRVRPTDDLERSNDPAVAAAAEPAPPREETR